MKRLVFFALMIVAAFCTATAHAQEAAIPSGATAQNKPSYPPVEYRFNNPQLLTQQLIWGIFHGVRLLGLTCQARGDRAAALAYADWAERQRPRIQAAERDLARYYYRRDSATPEAISTALGLKPALDVSPELLQAACNTLPEALTKERYDLNKFYVERRAAVQRGDADAPKGIWKEPEEVSPSKQPSSENTESQPKENP
ncbi:MAG TPA: hypothetical protein VFW68_12190 [Rhodocyclaceae bacterium]|nr:hypothetical protein [Rhodocyclaceae bacterium]